MSYLFVGGSQRSGTTLLNKLLCLDPATNPKIAEASYLSDLMLAYDQAQGDFEQDTQSYFSSPADLRQFHASLVNLFLSRTRSRFSSAETLVLKEPHLTQYFPQLYELVPRAKFMVIARDPRDIITSMIQVGERMAEQNQQHFFQQRNIAQLCQHVLSFYAPSLNCQDAGFQNALLVIRYEDLIHDFDSVLEKLKSFTGLRLDIAQDDDPNQSMQGAAENASMLIDKPRYQAWITENNNKTMNASSIGVYKNCLSEAEIEQVNNLMSPYMNLFAYT